MAQTGTYDFNDLASITASPQEVGLDALLPAFEAELESHNRVAMEIIADFASPTTEKEGIYGGASDAEMMEVDEYGDAPTQKTGPGGQVAYPLGKKQHNTGWDEEFFLKGSVAEMRTRMIAAENAHKRALIKGVKQAIYTPTNRTVVDTLGRPKGVTLTVRALLNGDGQPIPAGPNGEPYDGATESHYSAEATLSSDGLRASVRKVLLKGYDADPRIAINLADSATVAALDGFVAAISTNINVTPTTGGVIPVANRGPVGDRMIGTFDDVPVYVKPWAIAGYALTYDAGASSKVLRMRQEPIASLQGLRLINPDESGHKSHPLYARVAEARFGFGVHNRAAAAVHEFGTDATYTAPAI